MERKVIEAAMKGDVEKLQNLIKDDPFLLSAASLGDGDTPLHIGCIGGHLEFVKEVLLLCPEFAAEINQDGLSPLHMASARGDVKIVKELLKLGSHLCLAKGRESRIPLHSAVAKGRTRVMAELLSASPDSIAYVTARGETCFHLAVRFNRYEALKVLCDHVVSFGREEILNNKDSKGNTVLHLAASTKQYQVFDLLLEKKSGLKGKLEVRTLNKKKRTPFDILISEGGDCDIEEILATADSRVYGQEQSPEQEERRRVRPRSASQKLQDYFKYNKMKESPSKARNTLLIVTVLIVTATYQAVLSPPGGVWEDDFALDQNSSSTKGHVAGQSVMGTNRYVSYALFLLFNSMGFVMSVHLIYFLTHGFPLQYEIRVALLALTATYDTCMVAIAPKGILSSLVIALSVTMPITMVVLTKLIRNFNKRRLRPCLSQTA